MPKKEFRVKREVWNHKYRVVARNSKGQIVNNRGWHTAHDRQIIVDKTFTFQEGARYSYLVRAHDEYGNPRNLTITSSRAVNLGRHDSYERQRLFDEVKSKYIRKDEKYKKLENFSVVARTDLNTRAKKVYS